MFDRSILRLRLMHRRLEHEIAHEQTRRAPDPFRIARLKKLRLAVKDCLAGYRRRRAGERWPA